MGGQENRARGGLHKRVALHRATRLKAELMPETVRAYEERRQRAWPEYGQHARRGSGDRREELYPEMPGFDERVLTGALGWLNPEAAQSPEERARCLAIMRALLQLTFDRIPKVDDAEKAKSKACPLDSMIGFSASSPRDTASDVRRESRAFLEGDP